MTVKTLLLGSLERAGLLNPAYRAYEAAKSLRAQRETHREDGVPLPPSRLRREVAGTPDPAWFLESGRRTAETIVAACVRAGVTIEAGTRVLDFGCGCGRVARHWRELADGLDLSGTDYNERLAAWCAQNLDLGSFTGNRLAPPLAHRRASFDVVYAVSVFTHLPEDLQLAWLGELARVLRPGGLLLLTTHGDAYLERLTADERRRFRSGELVVRWESVAGTNLCTTFHPEAYVKTRLARGFDLLELLPEGATGTPRQDLIVLRRTEQP